MTAVPATPDALADLTPDWLTAALSDAGVLRCGRVRSARCERIGQEFGFTGVIARVHLECDEDDQAPSSVVAKLPMARDDFSSGYRKRQDRDPVLVERSYERSAREIRFYRECAVPFAPALYYASADEVERRVVLLLEDVNGRQGDVLRGCSVDDATLVMEQLAPLHARWWGSRAATERFPPASTDDPQTRQERYARHVPRFLSAYGRRFPSELNRIVERLGSGLAIVAATLQGRSRTLTHGDLHLDNMIFRDRSVVVLDWQTACVGPPAWDVAVFLVGSLDVPDRRDAEDDLLQHYVALLCAHGVSEYSLSDLQLEYRLALLRLLAGTVVWLTALEPDELNARERALKEATLAADGRLAAAVLDHGVQELLAT